MAVISPTGLLGTRSPILITWNGTGTAASDILYFKLEIYAWTGDKDVRPASPTYTINRTSGFVDSFPTADIAPLLENYISQGISKIDLPSIATLTPSTMLWVEIDYDIEYLDAGFVVNDTGTTTRFLVTDGYSKFVDNANASLEARILINDISKNMYEFDTYMMPIYLGDVGSSYQTDIAKVLISGSDGTTAEVTAISGVLAGENSRDRVALFPSGIANLQKYLFDQSITSLTEMRLLDWYDIKILNSSDAVLDSRRFYNQCEPKFTPIQLQFVNRFGMWDTLTFFKRSDDSITLSKEKYRSVVGSASATGYNWGDQGRGMRSFNHEVKKSITMNTGFVDENTSETIQDLIMSEYVLMTINRTTERVQDTYTIAQDFRAVVINTESLVLQKHINDKTINYTIQVEFGTPENAML